MKNSNEQFFLDQRKEAFEKAETIVEKLKEGGLPIYTKESREICFDEVVNGEPTGRTRVMLIMGHVSEDEIRAWCAEPFPEPIE